MCAASLLLSLPRQNRSPLRNVMKPQLMRAALSIVAIVLGALPAEAEVALVTQGQAEAAIHVSPEVMEANRSLKKSATAEEAQAEAQRQRLRESVEDLAYYLEKMSGASI